MRSRDGKLLKQPTDSVIMYYSKTCLNRILNKTECCIYKANLKEIKSKYRKSLLIEPVLTDHSSIPYTKADLKEVWLRPI
jgi:hypothetical protein